MIRFEHVHKAYDLQAGRRTLFDAIKLVTNSSASNDLFYALSDVNFSIGKGEAFGIIGRNGAGKSTVLKLIAGITKPTHGKVEVNGLVSSLIELGAGFHPDLTGRENVYMSGAILGIPKKSIDAKFKEIVDFSELWDFIDVPVKKYSSGMYARLGFAVAVSVNPEILIIDEILSVGDIFFQQKCFNKMREIRTQGTTFIFVTHDTNALQNLCDRVLFLEAGQVEFEGNVNEAVNRYYAKVGGEFGRAHLPDRVVAASTGWTEGLLSPMDVCAYRIKFDEAKRFGDRLLEIVAARVTNSDGADVLHVQMTEILDLHLLVRANEDIAVPCVGIHFYDRFGNIIFAAGTPQLRHDLPSLKKGQQLVVQFEVRMNVGPGEYTFSLLAAEPSAEGGPNIGFFHDQVNSLGPVLVTADQSKVLPFYGVAQLPMKISHGLPDKHS